MSTFPDMRLVIVTFLLSCCLGITACGKHQAMNAVEFEPHLGKPFCAKEIYGVGFQGYDSPDSPGNIRLLGWMQDAYTRNIKNAKLVHIGPPKVLLSSKDGEEHLVPLKWVGEVPPREFDGKLFIRIYDLEEGLIHWDPDPLARWDP